MRRLAARSADERAAALPQVLDHLRADGLIACPTETVYGIGGAITARAVEALAELKQRDPSSPFLLLVPDADRAPGVRWTDTSRRVAELFWPGPLTIVLDAEPGAFPAGISGQDGTVAVRASSHPFVRELMSEWRAPITSTSANAAGGVPARDADAVMAVLESLGAEDVLVIDGGSLQQSKPSTIVAVEGHTVRVIRSGAIDGEELTHRLSGIGIHVG